MYWFMHDEHHYLGHNSISTLYGLLMTVSDVYHLHLILSSSCFIDLCFTVNEFDALLASFFHFSHAAHGCSRRWRWSANNLNVKQYQGQNTGSKKGKSPNHINELINFFIICVEINVHMLYICNLPVYLSHHHRQMQRRAWNIAPTITVLHMTWMSDRKERKQSDKQWQETILGMCMNTNIWFKINRWCVYNECIYRYNSRHSIRFLCVFYLVSLPEESFTSHRVQIRDVHQDRAHMRHNKKVLQVECFYFLTLEFLTLAGQRKTTFIGVNVRLCAAYLQHP